jgi:hypothetical protein
MPIYWVTDYFLAQGKTTEFQDYMKSDRAKELFAELERETGVRYIDTYMTVLGFGKYDCEDWFIAPDWSALDKMDTAQVNNKFAADTADLVDMRRPWRSRALRSIQDVQIHEPPKEKQKPHRAACLPNPE